MSNTVMKDAAKTEHAFTSDETMRYKYLLREGIDIQVITRITSYSVEDIQRIAKENLQS